MHLPQKHVLRVVVQQILSDGKARLRVIVYGDTLACGKSDFENVSSLLGTLHRAIPNFDDARISLHRLDEGNGAVLFAEEMELDHSQVSVLGLA
ncbi:MAG TPA: hypothetical protein VIY53_13180 [Acidobacteriaceae bacterium]